MTTPISKRTTSPAFQWYPKDYLSSSKVQRMSMTERGIYQTLLSHCWLDNGLPADLAQLARIVGMKSSQFSRIWTSGPLCECFYERGGLFHHDRLDQERRKQAEYRRRQSDKGKASAAARFNHGSTTVQPGPVQPEGNSSSPISNLRSPSKTPSGVLPRARAATLVQPRRRDAAWEGPRVYVPHRVHQDFVGFRNHSGAEAELLAWYQRISDEWTTGARQHDPAFTSDMVKFWKARYDEEWPPVTPASSKGRPSWAV